MSLMQFSVKAFVFVCVLVLFCALTSTPSPAPPFVLLQGEIGRPGLKVSCSSSPAHLVLLNSLRSISSSCPWCNGIRIFPTVCLYSPLCDLSIDVLRISSAAAKWVPLH